MRRLRVRVDYLLRRTGGNTTNEAPCAKDLRAPDRARPCVPDRPRDRPRTRAQTLGSDTEIRPAESPIGENTEGAPRGAPSFLRARSAPRQTVLALLKREAGAHGPGIGEDAERAFGGAHPVTAIAGALRVATASPPGGRFGRLGGGLGGRLLRLRGVLLGRGRAGRRLARSVVVGRGDGGAAGGQHQGAGDRGRESPEGGHGDEDTKRGSPQTSDNAGIYGSIGCFPL